ncbi:WYL domain-containing protein [Paludifilum halophilum]|uniref:WYL domain-containing protein n=1 Tax=Paludifilum halophilum TaxID=1642702 RepID=UPI00308456C5
MVRTDHPGNEWIPAILVFHHEQEAIEYILGFGDKMKIVEPSNLVEKVVSKAKSVIHFYDQ